MGEVDCSMLKAWEKFKLSRLNTRMNQLSRRSRKNSNNQQNSSTNINSADAAQKAKYEALFKAARKRDPDGFIKALENISLNTELSLSTILGIVDESGDTLLHVIVCNENREILRLGKNERASLLTKKNSNGDTVWHICAKIRSYNILLFFLSLRKSCKKDLTYANTNVMKKYVTWEDLSLKAKNKDGNTALHEAFIHRDESMASLLMKEDVEVSYHLNSEDKSALYLASEANYIECLDYMLRYNNAARNGNTNQGLQGKSLIHGAIMGRSTDALHFLRKYNYNLINSRDEDMRNPFHWAACIGFNKGVCYLLENFSSMTMEMDSYGLLPIHCASMNGHIDVVETLLQISKDPNMFLTCDGQNALHIAAKTGRDNIVTFLLNTHKLEPFINKADAGGNTPLHLATVHWHPKIVDDLIRDNKVDLNKVNNEGLTALDAAEYSMKGISSFNQWLAWQVLKAAGARRAASREVLDAKLKASKKSEFADTDSHNYKNSINILLLVSILVAMVALKAICTLTWRGDNGIGLLGHVKYFLFSLCGLIASCSSVAVVLTLIWAVLMFDEHVICTALRLAKPLLGMAGTMMCLALMNGAYIVVGKLDLLADIVLTTAMVSLVLLAMFFLPICLPYSCDSLISQCIASVPIRLIIWVHGFNYEMQLNTLTKHLKIIE